MNSINRGLVYLVLLPKFLYERMGVDTNDLAIILRTKLLMDDRRPNSLHVTRPQKAGKQISAATLGTILLSAAMGVFFLVSFAVGSNLLTQASVYFLLYITMLTLTLITDFTSVLIDVRDNQIILPKPVSSKTFTLSRLLHIFIHINKIILPMSLAGQIYIGYRYGLWAALTFLFSLFLLGIFCILIINMIYLLILKFTSPQKFKTIISYVQIGMTVVIYGLSQILPRMINFSETVALDISQKSWRWLLPPYWFSRGWKFLSRFETGWEDLLGIGLLLTIPVVSIWVVVRFLAPTFTRKLASLGASAEDSSSRPAQVRMYKPSFWKTLSLKISTLLTKGPEEKVGFLIVWNLTGRLRDFKLKVYPGIGYITVIFGLMIYNFYNRHNSAPAFSGFVNAGIVLGIAYASGLMLLTAVSQLQYSDSFKASWIYLVAPVRNPGHIFSGAVKAAITKFYIPVILIITAIVVYLFGWRVIPNLVLGFSNVILCCLIISLVTFRNLPFSTQQSSANQTGMMIRTFACMGLAGLIGFLHYFIFSILPVVFLGIVLSMIACWLVLGSIKKRSWFTIKASYEV